MNCFLLSGHLTAFFRTADTFHKTNPAFEHHTSRAARNGDWETSRVHENDAFVVASFWLIVFHSIEKRRVN